MRQGLEYCSVIKQISLSLFPLEHYARTVKTYTNGLCCQKIYQGKGLNIAVSLNKPLSLFPLEHYAHTVKAYTNGLNIHLICEFPKYEILKVMHQFIVSEAHETSQGFLLVALRCCCCSFEQCMHKEELFALLSSVCMKF